MIACTRLRIVGCGSAGTKLTPLVSRFFFGVRRPNGAKPCHAGKVIGRAGAGPWGGRRGRLRPRRRPRGHGLLAPRSAMRGGGPRARSRTLGRRCSRGRIGKGLRLRIMVSLGCVSGRSRGQLVATEGLHREALSAGTHPPARFEPPLFGSEAEKPPWQESASRGAVSCHGARCCAVSADPRPPMDSGPDVPTPSRHRGARPLCWPTAWTQVIPDAARGHPPVALRLGARVPPRSTCRSSSTTARRSTWRRCGATPSWRAAARGPVAEAVAGVGGRARSSCHNPSPQCRWCPARIKAMYSSSRSRDET